MLNDKEIIIYETIHKFISNNGYSPTLRELCQLLSYKSTKTIYNYLQKLKNKNYIDYQSNKKRSITINNSITNKIKVFNTNKFVNISINSNQLIFQIKNNYFNNRFIKKNDYLIINIKRKIKNNDLGLFKINNEYKIMKYCYNDGFYILEDNSKEILYKINLIGVVEQIYRSKI